MLKLVILSACTPTQEVIEVYAFDDLTKVNTISHLFKDGNSLYFKVEGEFDGSIYLSQPCWDNARITHKEYYTSTDCYRNSKLHHGKVAEEFHDNLYQDVMISLNLYPNTARKGRVVVTMVDCHYKSMNTVLRRHGLLKKETSNQAPK